MRLGLSCTFGALLLAACFNPEEKPGETDQSEDGTGTEGTSGGPGVTSDDLSTTADPSTDPDSATTTAGVDQPPSVELLVNGSASPPDLAHAAPVPLLAQATDDGSVTRVDFYDGSILVGSDDTEPFELELLLTSADGGPHSLSARAYDDADQEGQSNTVELVVAVTGGGTVASETNLFQMGGIFFHPGIGVVLDHDDNVVVAGSLSTADFGVVGLAVQSLAPDLASTNWQLTVPMSLVDGQPQFLTFGQPVLSLDGSTVAIGGNAMGPEGVIQPNVAVLRVAADGSGPQTPFLQLPSDPDAQNIPLAGIARDPSGAVLVGGPDDMITKIDPVTGMPLWQSAVGQAWTIGNLGGHRIRVDDEGDVIFDIFECMGGSCTLSTRKINGFDGNELWTEQIAVSDGSFFLHVGGSAPGPDGQVLTLHGPPLSEGGGLHMVLRADNGAVLQDLSLGGEGDTFAVADLAFDAQGYVVAVGTRFIGGDQDAREGAAIRFSTEGEVLWQRPFGFGSTDDQAMALAFDRYGRVVVVGLSDLDIGFLVFLGDVWVAQLDL
ncbi:MAG: Ig-like domain-containing protein [Myxococcales bacterium]|nr:hypothetical protein [Myxococcales bacterium]MCB9716403.1 Ig-like domain-containing protein [Myxococcales bacterium]